ncbi:MAG: hypothetical protein AAF708_16845 [Deinococcota bacterium]
MEDWIWVLIPLTALSIPIINILSKSFERIIKLQGHQAGPAVDELTADVASLKDAVEQQRQYYEQRIANLEAIVIAQAEQTPQSPALPLADERYRVPDLGNDEKVATIAEQLKG